MTGMRLAWVSLVLAPVLVGCGGDDGDGGDDEPLDPNTAPVAVIDRFSGEGAILLDRAEMPSLPAAGAPIDFDQAPFLVRGLGPGGERVVYYHLDAHQAAPINIYRLHYEGDPDMVPGQLPIVDYLPGDHGYSDLWRIIRIDVPADYVANTATSSADLSVAGWPFTASDIIVNCPAVPFGSTATRRRGAGSNQLFRGWYKDQVFYYFTFEEAPLRVVDSTVPTSTVYAAFNTNPGAGGGGWPSGFMTESGSDRTHVVADALDGAGYSPLREVVVYDNAAFASVTSLATAQAAPTIATELVRWNAPIVEIEP